MTDATQKAVELLDKLTALSEKYAPKVYQTAVDVVQIQAVGEIITAFLVLIASFFYFRKMNKINKDGFFDDKDEAYVALVLFVGAALCVLSLVAVFGGLGFWNWVALFNPELALAHKILNI